MGKKDGEYVFINRSWNTLTSMRTAARQNGPGVLKTC